MAQNAPITTDATDDASIYSLNIQQVRAIRNDSYLYMSVETVSQSSADAQIELQIDSTGDGQADTLVSMRPGEVMAQQGDGAPTRVYDAGMAINTVIELRLPLRLMGTTPHIVSLCLSSARQLAFPQPPDCMESPIQIGRVNQIDPAPVRYSDNPIVAVRGDEVHRINVRNAPSTDARVITTVPYGAYFAAVGRTADSQWIQVQSAAYVGWLATETLFTPGNLAALPVTG